MLGIGFLLTRDTYFFQTYKVLKPCSTPPCSSLSIFVFIHINFIHNIYFLKIFLFCPQKSTYISVDADSASYSISVGYISKSDFTAISRCWSLIFSYTSSSLFSKASSYRFISLFKELYKILLSSFIIMFSSLVFIKF